MYFVNIERVGPYGDHPSIIHTPIFLVVLSFYLAADSSIGFFIFPGTDVSGVHVSTLT